MGEINKDDIQGNWNLPPVNSENKNIQQNGNNGFIEIPNMDHKLDFEPMLMKYVPNKPTYRNYPETWVHPFIDQWIDFEEDKLFGGPQFEKSEQALFSLELINPYSDKLQIVFYSDYILDLIEKNDSTPEKVNEFLTSEKELQDFVLVILFKFFGNEWVLGPYKDRPELFGDPERVRFMKTNFRDLLEEKFFQHYHVFNIRLDAAIRRNLNTEEYCYYSWVEEEELQEPIDKE